MNKQVALLALFLSTLASPIFSQITIGGGVSIDIKIPIPDVIIVERAPQPVPERTPRPRTPQRHTCNDHCHHHETLVHGQIQNQNGPIGNQTYTVLQAQLAAIEANVEVVSYLLDSGDVLELFIVTANGNDYNYHSYEEDCQCSTHNRIAKILLNGQYLALNNASLSLQPKGESGFHSVINIHSLDQGDFNGTINF